MNQTETGYARSVLVAMLLLGNAYSARADAITYTCDPSGFKADPIKNLRDHATRLRIEKIEVSIAKNFNTASARIEHTLSDGTVVSWPPYFHHYWWNNSGFSWGTFAEDEQDGRHYVGALSLDGGGAVLTETTSDTHCTTNNCHATFFSFPCEPE